MYELIFHKGEEIWNEKKVLYILQRYVIHVTYFCEICKGLLISLSSQLNFIIKSINLWLNTFYTQSIIFLINLTILFKRTLISRDVKTMLATREVTMTTVTGVTIICQNFCEEKITLSRSISFKSVFYSRI